MSLKTLLSIHLLFCSVFCSIIQRELKYERKILSPDGFAKSVITVNGQFPGPMLNGSIGDVMVITVLNNLPFGEQLSVHWHGINQINTSWSDGAAGITNCPIEASTNYTYEFSLTECKLSKI